MHFPAALLPTARAARTGPVRRLLVLAAAIAVLAPARTSAEDKLIPVDVGRVKLGGTIGRRIEITCTNNLLKLDYEGDFLKPFQERNRSGGYIGLGKTIDALVRMAAHTGQVITYDQMLNSEFVMAPNVKDLTLDGDSPLLPDADGRYPIPEPGVKKDREY